MKMPISLWLFLIPVSSIFITINITPVFGKCLNDQKLLLLEFRASLKYNSSLSTKVVRWNGSEDCCGWDGIECDGFGHVIGLDLSSESIASEINDSSSLFSLHYLQDLNLANNDLIGAFPKKIFQVPTLKTIDLSNNRFLKGSLPEFPQNGALQNLVLSYTQFSGILPDSIGNLRMLSRLELGDCNFIGQLPGSMEKLTQLISLHLQSNKFTGSLPSLRFSKNLTFLYLDFNNLSGEMPPPYWEGLEKLAYLTMSNNLLSGAIPESLFSLPSLLYLDLSNNRFSGQIGEFKNVASHQLYCLDLTGNKFEGPIPEFLFKLKGLECLSIAGNNFMGRLELNKFGIFKKLTSLDLSDNMLSIHAPSSGSAYSSLPQFERLLLASCNIQEFPDLKNQSTLRDLDLSDNRISGQIPNWIWKVGSGEVFSLNLSHNKLEGPIPPSIGNMAQLISLDLSINKLSGNIPGQLANLTSLSSLNLSYNQLVGKIPQSPRFQTFTEKSFEGNKGLCGAPLKKKCDTAAKASEPSPRDRKKAGTTSMWIGLFQKNSISNNFHVRLGSA